MQTRQFSRSFFSALLVAGFISLSLAPLDGSEELTADLLVVGGTESGCAAAVQAARMGVKKVILVNDIEWLGGQFSAEAVGAIDENRAHGYDGSVPIPRSGIFREVIDAIEDENAERYGGIRRPGNTRVITTSRPVVSEKVFRDLLAPYEVKGAIIRRSNFRVEKVLMESGRVVGVRFLHSDSDQVLTVRAPLTIDASDWGDVIQESGAAWDVGIDARSEFGEPSAPESGEPTTDLNPITWCLILEEKPEPTLFPEPDGYDPRYFSRKWGWMNEEFAYSTRRLVDGNGFAEIQHPDIVLINSPPIDYPLDVYPVSVATALEATETGASEKSLVAMTPAQREIVFADARQHSLKYFFHLRKRFLKFRRMALSEEFGTEDRLPPKPYIRESLRLKAMHVLKEHEVIGFEARSDYASRMFPDAVFSWQFELDFHPTKRAWTTDEGAEGPWEADFRGNRRFGRSGTGRCVFPLRSLVPESVDGLLGAQKNLGYSSIVSSSCRLHDQSIHAGQAAGAVAAIAIQRGESPRVMWNNPPAMAAIWSGLLNSEQGAPLAIWPFADLDPYDKGFTAVQQLALRRVFNLQATDTRFEPDEIATPDWIESVVSSIEEQGYEAPQVSLENPTRRTVAIELWNGLAAQSIPETLFSRSWAWKKNPDRDGIPGQEDSFVEETIAIDFTGKGTPQVDGYRRDEGALFKESEGMGWARDLQKQTRTRDIDPGSPRDSFVFTRAEDVWELVLPDGLWEVTACIGDIGHEQPGQHLEIEGDRWAADLGTSAGSFHEMNGNVKVTDGRLTLRLGVESGGSNTCLNWIVVRPATKK